MGNTENQMREEKLQIFRLGNTLAKKIKIDLSKFFSSMQSAIHQAAV